MSKLFALVAALAILELNFCAFANAAETDSAEVPPNTESIGEAAEKSEQSKADEVKAALRGEMPEPSNIEAEADKTSAELPTEAPAKKKVSKPVLSDDTEPAAESAPKKKKTAKKVVEEEEEEDEDGDVPKADKEQEANAYMAEDDSRIGAHHDPQAQYEEGCMYLKTKQYQKALDCFSRALQLNPRMHEASYKKALVYQLAGYDKFAARRYQDVLRYRPDMDQARINLAALHRKHKHYVGAEEQYRAVIARNYFCFEAHYNLANVLIDLKRPEEAMKEYKVCQKLKPNAAHVHNNIGVLFLQKNYPEEALQQFKKAASLSPQNSTYQTNVKATAKIIAEKKAKGTTM